ncbi:MAG: hypothetical protein QM687_04280 [Ferruginibacter sp.]
MKKLKLLLPAMAIAAIAFTSCDDTDDTTALQKLQNKWSVDSLVFKTTTSGTTTTVKYTGTADDYYDFRTDNNLYYDVHSTPRVTDTVPYSLIGSTTLVTDGDTSSIAVLNSSRLSTYTRSGTTTDYLEVYGYFRR